MCVIVGLCVCVSEAELEQLQKQEDDIEFHQALIEEREENIKQIEVRWTAQNAWDHLMLV